MDRLTDDDLLKWYEQTVVMPRLKNSPSIFNTSDVPARPSHDFWNLYAYGDTLKCVYVKCCAKQKRENEEKRQIEKKIKPTGENAERFAQSVSRARKRVFELAVCNDFQHFCTFTQSAELRDRFDLKAFRADLAMMIRNLNRTREESNKIRYLLIPEHHKNGAWHMHGLLQGLTADDLRPFRLSEHIPERIKKTIREGTPVYDWTRYRRAFGYFTCTEIRNTEACAKYITKYVTKALDDQHRESGEHLFFASQGLKSREVLSHWNMGECPFERWDYENEYVKIVEVSLDELRTAQTVAGKNELTNLGK